MRYLVLICLMATGCSSGSDLQDLTVFTQQILSQPRGRIEPLPEFKPYSAFVYGASGLRSPFESPAGLEDLFEIQSSTVGAPDLSRPKQALESYSLADLQLVGTLSKGEGSDTLSGLVQTSQGNVHTIAVGNYLGKNHGRVIAIREGQLDLIEVVPNGSGGWISRPHSIPLKGTGEN